MTKLCCTQVIPIQLIRWKGKVTSVHVFAIPIWMVSIKGLCKCNSLVPALYYQIIWILAACSGSVSMQGSMSHHIFPQLLSSPFWSQLKNIMNEDLNFFHKYLSMSSKDYPIFLLSILTCNN